MKYRTCHANPLVSFLYLFFYPIPERLYPSSLVSFFPFFLFHLLCKCRSFEKLLLFIYFLYAPILFPSLYFHSLSCTILNSPCLLSFHSTRRQPLCISNPGTYYMKINKNKHAFMFPKCPHFFCHISIR